MYRFLALGDSYTVGESVDVAECWPVQLVAALRKQGLPVEEPVIVACTGWTTDELMAGIERSNPQGPFDLVGLLIGVNNQYRGRGIAEYRRQFCQLLAQAIEFASDEPGKVIVLSIPDWGVTTFAAGLDTQRIAKEIDCFNAVNRVETVAVGAHYVDVIPISRLATADRSLIAGDGLHPSGKMYAAWVELVLPVAVLVLKRSNLPFLRKKG